MAKKKRMRTVGWTVPIHVGGVRIPIHGKTLKAAKAAANRFTKNHLKNTSVALGKWVGGKFHPFRSSHDYIPGLVGEFPRKGKSPNERMALERRFLARGITKRARHGRQSVS